MKTRDGNTNVPCKGGSRHVVPGIPIHRTVRIRTASRGLYRKTLLRGSKLLFFFCGRMHVNKFKKMCTELRRSTAVLDLAIVFFFYCHFGIFLRALF